MRPTFMGFETSKLGLQSTQKALDIVNNNQANIGVTGYTRQRVDLVSLHVNMRNSRILNNSVPFAGQGVAAYGVSQLRDPFLDKRFREEYSDVGYYTTTSNVLADLQAALDEIEPTTMSKAMDNFKTAWNELAAKSSEPTNAANVLAEANKIVSIFQQMSSKVDNVWYQQEYDLQADVEKVNTILRNIATLNEAIVHEKFNCLEVGNENYQPLELLDQRNLLLDELSAFADISYREEKDGSVTVNVAGQEAVKGKSYDQLAMQTMERDTGLPTAKLVWNSTGKGSFLEGSLSASLQMLNGAGPHLNASEGQTNDRGIHYYKEKINEFARVFVEQFNQVIERADSSGVGYTPPRYKTLFTFANDNERTAANIRLNTDWENDSDYLIEGVLYKEEDGKETNVGAAKAYALFSQSLNFGEFNGTIDEYIRFYSVSKLGNDKDFADTRLEAVNSIAGDLLDQIQEVSGVSFDEEGVQMMTFQKAYQAMSRMFTTLDDCLNTLINSTGRVGL